MDYESSSKFISSLAKFLQSLCNGYVEFDNGVQVIGHLYLSVDTGKTIDYILNEKVCKTDENSVTFISNSFHAQPAEKPKPPGKRIIAKDSDKVDTKNEEETDGYSNTQTEPRSTNVGTMPPSRNINQNSPLSHGAKRPYSPSHKQSQVKSGRTSPKHKKSKSEFLEQSGQSQMSNPASDNSISSAPSPADDVGPSHLAQLSDTAHTSQLNESYQQSFFHPDEENSLADEPEERDIKPTIDTDVTFIKEEFAPSSSCSQSGNDRTHGEESLYPYQSNQVFPGYGGSVGFGASQRSGFSPAGTSHAFSLNSGQASKTEGDGLGDQSDSFQSTVREEYCDTFAKGAGSVHYKKASRSAGGVSVSSKRNNSDRGISPSEDQESGDSSYSLLSSLYDANQPNASGMFECETCGRAYSYRRCLQRHMWQCNRMRQLMCTICKKEFYRTDKLRTHMRHLHNVELPRQAPTKYSVTGRREASPVAPDTPVLSNS